MKTPIIQIYPQGFPHGEAYIVATRDGLEELRNILNAMLSSRSEDEAVDTGSQLVFSSDGEGYRIIIQKSSAEDIEVMMSHYVDEEYSGSPGRHPLYHLTTDDYKKLNSPSEDLVLLKRHGSGEKW